MTPVGHRTLLAFAAGLLLVAPVRADSLPPAISVTGEATISVPPDLAEVEAGVTSDARTAHDASEANNATMGKLLLALKAAGIDAKDIQTSRLSLQPQSAPNRTGSPAITGYRASNRVTVRLHDVTKAASTIDMLVGAGANVIDGINFMVSQASKLLDDARTQAVADARRKAEIYAKAAGVTLGAPLSISEGGAAVPMFRAKVAAAMAPTPVAPGEETLSVTVNVTWAIKPAADQ
ncbi:MAG: SIMPL domain-containing protein [Bradyrhizobium sp.]|uniref:SIMPL domain-containing protein n=1 Tax=Bradyrhizobium sp. TaxID=376 RepID=UPI0023986448|nr:SIMPL domain-containing protein [Bradyrhizobium sp.]MDE2602808.1 SIMPL domain-containing protein [Bradyrhizobium sp.]